MFALAVLSITITGVMSALVSAPMLATKKSNELTALGSLDQKVSEIRAFGRGKLREVMAAYGTSSQPTIVTTDSGGNVVGSFDYTDWRGMTDDIPRLDLAFLKQNDGSKDFIPANIYIEFPPTAVAAIDSDLEFVPPGDVTVLNEFIASVTPGAGISYNVEEFGYTWNDTDGGWERDLNGDGDTDDSFWMDNYNVPEYLTVLPIKLHAYWNDLAGLGHITMTTDIGD